MRLVDEYLGNDNVECRVGMEQGLHVWVGEGGLGHRETQKGVHVVEVVEAASGLPHEEVQRWKKYF